MQVKLTPSTYIKVTPERGYIANVANNSQLVVDAMGALWLSVLSYQFSPVLSLVERLRALIIMREIGTDELYNDYVEFLTELESCGLVTFSKDQHKEMLEPGNSISRVRSYSLKSLFFEITDSCNEKCIHCYIPQEKKSKGELLPLSKFRQLIDELCAIGGEEVILSGGEIMLHKSLFEMLDYCKQKAIRVRLLSNCLLMSNEQINSMKGHGVSSVQVSLYSTEPKIHDSITQVKGSFERTLSSIKKLQSAGIEVIIAVSVVKQNVESIIEILRFAKERDIEVNLDFAIMARENKTTDNLIYRLSFEDTKHLLQKIHSFDNGFLARKYQREVVNNTDSFNFLEYLTRSVCEVGQDNLCIAANGDVVPCPGWNSFVLGNVYTQSLTQIWAESPRLIKLREIKEKDFTKCINCDANNYCIRCMNRNYNECEDQIFTTPKHFCDVAHIIKDILET